MDGSYGSLTTILTADIAPLEKQLRLAEQMVANYHRNMAQMAGVSLGGGGRAGSDMGNIGRTGAGNYAARSAAQFNANERAIVQERLRLSREEAADNRSRRAAREQEKRRFQQQARDTAAQGHRIMVAERARTRAHEDAIQKDIASSKELGRIWDQVAREQKAVARAAERDAKREKREQARAAQGRRSGAPRLSLGHTFGGHSGLRMVGHVGGALLGGAAIYGAGDLATRFVSQGIELNREYQRFQLTMQMVLAMQNKVVDAQGREIEGAKKLAFLRQHTAGMYRQVRFKADSTMLPTNELMKAYAANIGFANRAGASDTQALNIIALVAQLAKAQGMTSDRQINHEIRALWTGDQIASAKIAREAGLTHRQIVQHRGQGDLPQLLEKKLSGAQDVVAGAQGNYERVYSTLVSKGRLFTQQSFEKSFEKLTGGLKNLNKFVTQEKVTEWAEKFSTSLVHMYETIEKFGKSGLFKGLTEFIRLLATNAGTLISVFAAWKAAGLASAGMKALGGMKGLLAKGTGGLKGQGGLLLQTLADGYMIGTVSRDWLLGGSLQQEQEAAERLQAMGKKNPAALKMLAANQRLALAQKERAAAAAAFGQFGQARTGTSYPLRFNREKGAMEAYVLGPQAAQSPYSFKLDHDPVTGQFYRPGEGPNSQRSATVGLGVYDVAVAQAESARNQLMMHLNAGKKKKKPGGPRLVNRGRQEDMHKLAIQNHITALEEQLRVAQVSAEGDRSDTEVLRLQAQLNIARASALEIEDKKAFQDPHRLHQYITATKRAEHRKIAFAEREDTLNHQEAIHSRLGHEKKNLLLAGARDILGIRKADLDPERERSEISASREDTRRKIEEQERHYQEQTIALIHDRGKAIFDLKKLESDYHRDLKLQEREHVREQKQNAREQIDAIRDVRIAQESLELTRASVGVSRMERGLRGNIHSFARGIAGGQSIGGSYDQVAMKRYRIQKEIEGAIAGGDPEAAFSHLAEQGIHLDAFERDQALSLARRGEDVGEHRFNVEQQEGPVNDRRQLDSANRAVREAQERQADLQVKINKENEEYLRQIHELKERFGTSVRESAERVRDLAVQSRLLMEELKRTGFSLRTDLLPVLQEIGNRRSGVLDSAGKAAGVAAAQLQPVSNTFHIHLPGDPAPSSIRISDGTREVLEEAGKFIVRDARRHAATTR